MEYILLKIDGIGLAYMRALNGRVVDYWSADGVYLFDVIPVGVASSLGGEVKPPDWAGVADVDRAATYDVEKSGDRRRKGRRFTDA